MRGRGQLGFCRRILRIEFSSLEFHLHERIVPGQSSCWEAPDSCEGSVNNLRQFSCIFRSAPFRESLLCFQRRKPCRIPVEFFGLAEPQNLAITLTNNGHVMQKFNTNDMAHQIPRCIEWLSSIHTLEPGDVVATGTNHRGLNPFMDGDKIELTIEKVGTLGFNVKDEHKRTWARITRLQHKDSGKEGPHTPQTAGKYAAK